MNAPHHGYHHPFFSELPLHLKVLFSMVLLIMGIGYIFGMIQIYEVHAGIDGKPEISVRDIQIAYAGNPDGSRLETALRGPMSTMATQSEIKQIIAWARTGADEGEFSREILPIIRAKCLTCHTGADSGLPLLGSHADILPLVETDRGASFGTLVRVSHIHLFGLTLVFAIMGFIFSHAYVRHRYLKSILIALPFLAILVDIGSWWLTKVSLTFAYTVIIAGGVMGISFLLQWLISAYQIWFLRAPPAGTRPD